MIPNTDLQFRRAYIAEVGFSPGNPIHRVLVTSWRGNTGIDEPSEDGTCDVWAAGYEERHNVLVSKLAYFQVLKEVPELNVTWGDEPVAVVHLPGSQLGALPRDIKEKDRDYQSATCECWRCVDHRRDL